eukprot:maker-scaffold2090_size21136-snap-gene-0.3 protein:Tk02947 transcript:maker-scaffold2090_size21136-snap-gene-0.3-mRNA-1 annotation:"tetratricopeptide repeat protein 5-like"
MTAHSQDDEDHPGLVALGVLVEDLYRFRDLFFESHPLSEAKHKPQLVREKLDQVLQRVHQIQNEYEVDFGEDPKMKAEALFLQGRALNIVSDHNPEAEKLLSRSVKLDPKLVKAWNELGECHWKKGDNETAGTCFEGALNHQPHKVCLRNLSITLRQTMAAQPTHEERIRSVESGLTKAREAVQMDTTDGLSWAVLGNAYLAHFFTVSQNPRTLKQAMSAYKQAEKDVIAKFSPDLYYNKGVTLKYEEDYVGALECFDRAGALDPEWDSPKEHGKALFKWLCDLDNLIQLKGKLKTKRFHALIEGIQSKHLGPYGGGKFLPSSGPGVELREVPFDRLQEGLNEKKVILGKVIFSLQSLDGVPFTFCLADQSGHCIVVNLYNLSPGKGVIIGDSVAIAEPFFSQISLNRDGKEIAFDLVRVESPLILVINGKKAAQDYQAGVQMSTYTKST